MPKFLIMNGRDENGSVVDVKMAVGQSSDGSDIELVGIAGGSLEVDIPRVEVEATISTSPSATTIIGNGSAILLDAGSLAVISDLLLTVSPGDIPTAATYLTNETQSSILHNQDDISIYLPTAVTNIYTVAKGTGSVNSGVVNRGETSEAVVSVEIVEVTFTTPVNVVRVSIDSEKVSYRGYANV